jgi:hypothetical protein
MTDIVLYQVFSTACILKETLLSYLGRIESLRRS